jgi:hypothetical protein
MASGPVCDGSVSAVRYIGGQLSVNFSRCESATVMEVMAQQMKYKFAETWAVGKSGDLQPIIMDRAQTQRGSGRPQASP